jgi:hypothetical protein
MCISNFKFRIRLQKWNYYSISMCLPKTATKGLMKCEGYLWWKNQSFWHEGRSKLRSSNYGRLLRVVLFVGTCRVEFGLRANTYRNIYVVINLKFRLLSYNRVPLYLPIVFAHFVSYLFLQVKLYRLSVGQERVCIV